MQLYRRDSATLHVWLQNNNAGEGLHFSAFHYSDFITFITSPCIAVIGAQFSVLSVITINAVICTRDHSSTYMYTSMRIKIIPQLYTKVVHMMIFSCPDLCRVSIYREDTHLTAGHGMQVTLFLHYRFQYCVNYCQCRNV